MLSSPGSGTTTAAAATKDAIKVSSDPERRDGGRSPRAAAAAVRTNEDLGNREPRSGGVRGQQQQLLQHHHSFRADELLTSSSRCYNGISGYPSTSSDSVRAIRERYLDDNDLVLRSHAAAAAAARSTAAHSYKFPFPPAVNSSGVGSGSSSSSALLSPESPDGDQRSPYYPPGTKFSPSSSPPTISSHYPFSLLQSSRSAGGGRYVVSNPYLQPSATPASFDISTSSVSGGGYFAPPFPPPPPRSYGDHPTSRVHEGSPKPGGGRGSRTHSFASQSDLIPYHQTSGISSAAVREQEWRHSPKRSLLPSEPSTSPWPPPSQPPPAGGGGRTQQPYPVHFTYGSLIQLSNGDLRRVEDLTTDDFVQSADLSREVQISNSTVIVLEPNLAAGTGTITFAVGRYNVKVRVEADLEHPFFVIGQGWSSASPDRTLARYQLPCQQLKAGDICISLTHLQQEQSSASPAVEEGRAIMPPPPPTSSNSKSKRPSSFAKQFAFGDTPAAAANSNFSPSITSKSDVPAVKSTSPQKRARTTEQDAGSFSAEEQKKVRRDDNGVHSEQQTSLLKQESTKR